MLTYAQDWWKRLGVVCVRAFKESWMTPSNPPSLRYTPIHVSSYYYICVYVSSYYYMCPHTAIYVSSYVRSHGSRPQIRHLSGIPPYMCPHTTTYVSSYCYICVLICKGSWITPSNPPSLRYTPVCVFILLHMCPHTAISGSYICVSSYYYICVLILLYQAPIYVSSYYYIPLYP